MATLAAASGSRARSIRQSAEALIPSALAADELPVMLNESSPFFYPVSAWDQRIQGNVTLRLHVDADGRAVPRVHHRGAHLGRTVARLRGARRRDQAPLPSRAPRTASPLAVSLLFPVHFRHPDGPPLPGDTVPERCAVSTDIPTLPHLAPSTMATLQTLRSADRPSTSVTAARTTPCSTRSAGRRSSGSRRVTRGMRTPVYGKADFFNPGGSVKDRIGLPMIESLEASGHLKPGGTIVEATSGNTGVGLALAAAIKGYRCIFTMPDKMSQEKVRLMKAFGAEVIITPTAVPPDHPQNYVQWAKRLVRETPGAVLAGQFENPANPAAHVATTGPELWEQTEGRITHFVASAGTGGTISGVGRYLKSKNPDIKIIAADPAGSVLAETVAHAWRRTPRRRAVQGGRGGTGLRAADARHDRGGRVHHRG